MSDDLLAGLSDPSADAPVVDLLDTMTDDGASAWVPEEAGEGVQGTLVNVDDSMTDTYKPTETVPVWTVELKDGTKVRVVGFATVLRREMRDVMNKGAKPGDIVAVKYFGEKAIQKGAYAGKPFKHYGVAHKAV